MSSKCGGRHRADEQLAVLLARGLTNQEAARQTAVSVRTITNRLADPAFCSRVRELRQEMICRAAGSLADALGEAIDTVRNLLLSADPRVRLGAARTILEQGVRLAEVADLEGRLAELEGRVEAVRRERDAPSSRQVGPP